VVCSYDAKKRLVALHHELNGNAFSFWTFAYNEHNQVTGKTFAGRQDAPVTLTITYRYNAQGQMTTWVVMENGRHTEATRELDAEGNCTKLTVVTTHLNTGVSLSSRHSYQYQAGNLVSSITDIGYGCRTPPHLRILRRPGKQTCRLPGMGEHPRRPGTRPEP
jgi:hypothetical protein